MKKTLLTFIAAATISTTIGVNAQAAEIVVKKGDTLSELAQKYDVSVNELKAANGLQSDLIVVDQKLSIAEPKKYYTVAAGDTLWKISQKYGVTVSNLQSWNNISGHIIHPNQKLAVNGSETAAAEQAPAAPKSIQQQQQQQQ
ncbi:MAG: LysM peptidoglycan-binding domain-containing protein, partial [Bacillus sp. (in: firmicutes)]